MPADNRKSRLIFDEVVVIVPLVIHAFITIVASCSVHHLTAFLCVMLIITKFAFNFRSMHAAPIIEKTKKKTPISI